MKCFHFTNGERRSDDGEDDVVSSGRARVSWARSLSIASSSTTNTTEVRRSEFGGESEFSGDSGGFFSLLAQNRRVCNDLRVFSFAELKSATRGFSRGLLIGEGGFGCVYRGVVVVVVNDDSNVRVCDSGDFELGDFTNSEVHVAVKQLNRYGFQGHKEWINEVNWLGVIKHPNLVKLVGYCAEDDERGMQRLLVYELMKNKSLEDHLLGRVPSPLPWITRLKIAQDAARGLAYLHEEMDFQFLHIGMLDKAEGYSHVSTSVVGTVGYAAPEYVLTGKLTIKSDVWSFGVVLYELITGRRAVERNLPRNEQKLLEWVRPYISDSKKFHLIVDSRLEGKYCKKSAQRLASLANKCLAKQPKSRPKMSEVVEILGSIIDEEASSQEETESKSVKVAEDESEELDAETEPTKSGNNYMRKVREIKERVNLRNKSIGKLDWKNWTPGLVKTS
ncbi:hypothetical protein BVRB_7g173790 [Beta vulgaris subsp. vulgaris]|nr:hypothetical protein BVRB_7g173790 [Beta vulgaris subsp. vulgaris]